MRTACVRLESLLAETSVVVCLRFNGVTEKKTAPEAKTSRHYSVVTSLIFIEQLH